ALDLGRGVLRFVGDKGDEAVLNAHRSCPGCERSFDEPDPRNFSFLSRHGRCSECNGYGSRKEIDPERLIESWSTPLTAKRGGPLDFFLDPPFTTTRSKTKRSRVLKALRAMESKGRIRAGSLEIPLAKWPQRALQRLFHGDSESDFDGLVSIVEEAVADLPEEKSQAYLGRMGRDVPCGTCEGGRLRSDWLSVQVGGKGIAAVAQSTVTELIDFFSNLELSGRDKIIGSPIVLEIRSRLAFLKQVGLPYLTLPRSATTLSTGEAQRIRLAAQLGSRLRGACYILDEPTIGLHPRDNERLLDTLRDLRNPGNSVLVIEHDDATMEAADTILDMGPGPGCHGGEVVAQGPLKTIVDNERSATAAYFRKRSVEKRQLARKAPSLDRAIEVSEARLHNLQNVSATFPLGALTVVTGVSGAGKSTLVRGVVEASVRRSLRGLRSAAVGCRGLKGVELVATVREVDQLPIGRTPRSTPATYVGFWDRIRNIFASTKESRALGYDKRRFSFNLAVGRCDACAGQGRNRMEMNFLPDVTVDCETCMGRRFNDETLQISYRGKSISDVLAMSVEEALDFFSSYPELTRSLTALQDLGLGYLTLGQPSTTLSGGEAQRVKLAVELVKTAKEGCLYLLDEPTTGLHMQDVERLVEVLKTLAAAGHAVIVIEHHLELIAGADWVVDLGPEGGDGGGKLVFQGTPHDLAGAWRNSLTGRCLREWVRK
ncbi:MAG: excinuclease ABC subunit UvrA, partial [Planctomycetes bacterium]|nr:excinuclease ABC subunit UvrA [Planctomycetota bacterium]